MGVVLLVMRPAPIVPGLALTQNQDAETLLYLAAFAVVLPLALFWGPRLADGIACAPTGPALGSLTALLAATLALAVLGVRASASLPWGDGVGTVVCAVAIWAVGAGLALRRALMPREWRGATQLPTAPLWVAAALMWFAVLLCVADLGSLSVPALATGILLLVAAAAAHGRFRLPALTRPWGPAVDVLIVVIVLLAVPDLVLVRPGEPAGTLAGNLVPLEHTIQFHQNFYLGPANAVLHGRAMLVDTASQYGVGSIYLLAGWFKLAPIGYGTLGFLTGVLSALVFAAGYAVLRLARASRLLAATALAVAVITLDLNLPFPINAIPQDGALRLGIPMAAILAGVARERWPRRRLTGAALLAVVGVASIWALEGFAYTLAAVAAMGAVRARLLPAGERLGWMLGGALRVAGACAGAHLLLAGATLATTGSLPEWGQYLEYLRAFLSGRLGDLNYDYGRWSPGLAVGAAYLASAAALVLLLLRRPDVAARERIAAVALAGLTGYGIAAYSYFNNRSSSFILAAVSLPALLAGALWLSLVLRSRGEVTARARLASLAIGSGVAILLVAIAWSSVSSRLPNSALAHAVPGGDSAAAALRRLWDFPPLSAGAPAGERLLNRYLPGQDESLVIAKPDLETEIFLRSNRVNVLPLAAPWQDSFVPSVRQADLERAVGTLKAGELMLIDGNARRAFAFVRRDPSFDPFAGDPVLQSLGLTPYHMAPMQLLAIKMISRRFDLRSVRRRPAGLEIVELVGRTD